MIVIRNDFNLFVNQAQRMKVHLHKEKNQVFIENLKSLLDDGIDLTWGDLLPKPPEYDILVCGVPDIETVEASPNLKTVIIPWAGLPRRVFRFADL